MLSRQSIPRIRVDLLDSSPRSLSPSRTLDIRDVLSQVQLLPNLLTENFVFEDADDALHLEDGYSQDVPPFPMGRQPPLFILHSHRTRLPFHIRPEAFEFGDFSWDEEDACPLLTVPTIPRMKLMIMERLYVQKWIDTLTSDNPPKHIPWACEKPAMERKWIAEGSIFPAAVVNSSPEQHGTIQEYTLVTDDTNGFSGLSDQVSHSRDLCACSEASAPIHVPAGSHTSASHDLVKSADVDCGILRGESKTSQAPHRVVRASQIPSPPTLLLSGPPPVGTTTINLNAPLAARRGKSLSGLKLKRTVIEQLEYPDIPTAFLGSPSVWSPRFDASLVPSFTDHQSMLLDLKLKCAGLGSGVSTYVQEPLRSQTEITHTSPSVDEWAFTRGLATFGNNVLRSNGSRCAREIIVDTSVFLPDDSSTPAKRPGFTARLEFAPRLHSMPASQSPNKSSCGPPGVPLPPRPALVSPSTSPHVRGILKKVKSVRFEDMIIKESQNHTFPVVPLPHASPERPSSLPLAIPSERPCTPIPTMAKPSSSPALFKEMPVLGRNIQEKKPTPKSRLPPKRTKTNGKLEPVHPNVVNVPESSKPTSATTSAEHPCRIALVKENTNPAAVAQAQAKQKGSSMTETDVRRGLEGPAKSRLSVPLRNIFRFR